MIGEIRQIGLVYKDISDKIKLFQEILGVNINVIDLTCKKNIHKEKITPYTLRIGLGFLGNTQIELIQPLKGETIYGPFLNKGKSGLHHIGIYVDDILKWIEDLESKGLKKMNDGILPGTKFAYFDTVDQFGFYIELLEIPKRREKDMP